jgi:capping protein alpha
LEQLRAGLQQRLQNYIRTSYTGDAAVGVFANDGKLSIAITGEKTNLKNFWSGKWNSTWSLIVDGGAASISGEVKVSQLLHGLWL